MLTLLSIAFTAFYTFFYIEFQSETTCLLRVMSWIPPAPWNYCMAVVKVEATNTREDTSCIVLCHCLYTGVAWGFWWYTIQFAHWDKAINSQTTRIWSNMKLLTTAVNPLSSADAKNSVLNPVSAPWSKKCIISISAAKVWVFSPLYLKLFSIFPFYCQDSQTPLIRHHMIAGHCALRLSSMAYMC